MSLWIALRLVTEGNYSLLSKISVVDCSKSNNKMLARSGTIGMTINYR